MSQFLDFSLYNCFVYFFFFLDINECAPDPCGDHGECEDLVNDYHCTCIPGFRGRNCEEGKRSIITTGNIGPSCSEQSH